jgi:hypothetical protein
MRPVNERVPLIVVKRRWFDAFATGLKTVEYRRYGRTFTERTFYPGRPVRIWFSYDPRRSGELSATVRKFERVTAQVCPEILAIYSDLTMRDLIAAIHLADIAIVRPAPSRPGTPL